MLVESPVRQCRANIRGGWFAGLDGSSSSSESSEESDDEDSEGDPWRGECCLPEDDLDVGREFTRVVLTEQKFIESNHWRRRAGSLDCNEQSGERFSLALSGGGVRAAAFAAGVVWHLAERGRLRDVDYITAVSGGSYLAAALATHMAALRDVREAQHDLDSWYRLAVARTLCRMQANMPYLSRDLGKEPWAQPQDGSGCLPRIFDWPIMIGVVAFAVLVRTAMLLIMLVVPLVEWIETEYGALMRANFCADVYAPKAILVTLLGRSKLETNAFVILVSVFCVFGLHVLLLTMRMLALRKTPLRTCLWLSLRSTLSVAIRGLVLWLVVTGLICGPVNWRFHRYQALGGTQLRLCQCRDFLTNTSKLRCPDLLWQEEVGQAGLHKTFGFIDWLAEHESKCSKQLPLFSGRPLLESVFPMLMLMLLAALCCALLLLPFFPGLFLATFNVAGPLVLFLSAFFLVQWRVLSPITGERLFTLSSELSNSIQRAWPTFAKAVLLLDMVLVLGFQKLKSAAHSFYSRSMRRAFYAGGHDWTWGDIRRVYQCPYLIFGTTVNDFMRPDDELPHSEFALGTLWMGGERTGYKRTWKVESLAKSSALSGGALDGFALAVHDSLALRFWLEFLGVHMGNFIRFRRSRAPSKLAKLPGLFSFGMVYGLMFLGMLVSQRGQCMSSAWFFAAASVSCSLLLLVSFFDFLPCLMPLHHSYLIRGIQQATQFYHQAKRPPSVVYVTDGGVLDNTGIVQLLRRRCRRILSVYAEEDRSNAFGSLREVLRIAERERLGSFYDPVDPRRGVWHAVLEFAEHPERRCLELNIRYGTGSLSEGEGQLVLVKNRLPPHWSAEPVRGLLTEEEVLGQAPEAGPDEELGDLRQAELGGCCCDCCHATVCNRCCGRFPEPPTANQWLTPQVFSSLCRLGRGVAAEALRTSDAIG